MVLIGSIIITNCQYDSNKQSFIKMIQQSEQVKALISLVPKHLRKYVNLGVFIIPNEALIPDYLAKKQAYLSVMKESEQPSVNSMHKYTSINPITEEDTNRINQKIARPLSQFYAGHLKHFAFDGASAKLFASFGITYNKGHKGLNLHTDDSNYTVNLCLQSSAVGNQVNFNEVVDIDPIEDYCLVHSGRLRHYTNQLKEGQRTNVVLWFK